MEGKQRFAASDQDRAESVDKSKTTNQTTNMNGDSVATSAR